MSATFTPLTTSDLNLVTGGLLPLDIILLCWRFPWFCNGPLPNLA